jgi:hypothetical protein
MPDVLLADIEMPLLSELEAAGNAPPRQQDARRHSDDVRASATCAAQWTRAWRATTVVAELQQRAQAEASTEF